MNDLRYVEADASMREVVAETWDEGSAAHLHFEDGFTILAINGERPVGLIGVKWRDLPAPLPVTLEAFIDIIGVKDSFRRQGVGRRLVEMSVMKARTKGVYQIRAWSSNDKVEAISMWKALRFAMCPAAVYPGGEQVKGYFVSLVL